MDKMIDIYHINPPMRITHCWLTEKKRTTPVKRVTKKQANIDRIAAEKKAVYELNKSIYIHALTNSIRTTAIKYGVSKEQVYNLLRGDVRPHIRAEMVKAGKVWTTDIKEISDYRMRKAFIIACRTGKPTEAAKIANVPLTSLNGMIYGATKKALKKRLYSEGYVYESRRRRK